MLSFLSKYLQLPGRRNDKTRPETGKMASDDVNMINIFSEEELVQEFEVFGVDIDTKNRSLIDRRKQPKERNALSATGGCRLFFNRLIEFFSTLRHLPSVYPHSQENVSNQRHRPGRPCLRVDGFLLQQTNDY